MDSSFDSDPSILHDHEVNDSDIDAQILAEQEMTQCQETINDLRKQNAILKAQFEQAVIITKQIDVVHEKNSQLSNQVRTLQMDNENLQRRLEICSRHNEELETQLASEKAVLAQHVSTASSEKELEVTKVQKQCNGKIETLLIRIRKIEEAKEQSDLAAKMMASKIDRLLQAASEFYHLTFDGIDTFTEFLHQPAEIPPCGNDAPNSKSENSENQKLSKKNRSNKSDKKKLKALRRHCEKFCSEVNRLQSELSTTETRYSSEIKNYQAEIRQLKDDMNLTQSEQNETIRLLQNKNQSLKNENNRLKKENNCHFPVTPGRDSPAPMTPLSPVSPIRFDHSEEVEMLREENHKLNQQNHELSMKVKSIEDSKNSTMFKLKEAETERTKLQLTVNRLESEKQAAVVVQNETISELKSLRERLKVKEERPKHETKLIDKLKEENSRLESTVQMQTDQLHNLHLQSENDKHERLTMQAKLRAAQSDIEEMQSKVSSLNDELAEANDKLNEKPEIKIDDIMPDSAFRFKEFDPKLTQKIEKVIENQYLAPQSKLNRIYKAILKHFTTMIEEKTGNMQHMSEHLEVIKQKINQFLVELSLNLSFDAVTFDDFIDRNAGQKLIERASESYKGFEELKRKNSQMNSIFSQLCDEFGPGVDLRVCLPNLKQQFEAAKVEAKQATKKLNELKKCNKCYKKHSKLTICDLEKQKSELKEQVLQLQTKVDALTSTNQDLKHELQMNKTELNSLRSSVEQSEDELREEHQSYVERLNRQHLSEKDQLKEQIKKMKSENQKAKAILSEHESSFGRMRKVLDQHEADLRAKDEEFDNYKRDKEKEIANLNFKFNTEKNQLTKTFEDAIDEIRRQCEEQRSDFSRVSKELKFQKDKIQSTLSTAAKYKRENQKLERTVRTLEEQIKRDQMITEASIKNQVMTIEENYSQQLQEAKAKIASEKRRIFSFAAEEFRKFYNPSELLDERSYKSLLNRIKKELERLTESDTIIRRLTGAAPRQATDEAVAKIVTP
ncbi:hypothetical protein TRFO_19463 [Tritrichomonas foetus]|uniref:Uncharacterized protein n=1 Tax=Tritrichomonas foetus TaxID=1144522 RepID=A0A1J4KMN1_9EUKA|nr:hypothetical protein [Tritrichomonas foetus]OHT11052.1 hypothetical protein TRFO_19463 [Tritrichomonas foetus]|eukprot:OHT11052.1 hypothetical protein TRFO_19463 [Tritrichomonas foetus]